MMNSSQQNALEKVKQIFFKGGEATMLRLKKAFQNVDVNHTGTLTKSELEQGLKEWGGELSADELSAVWDHFDRAKAGKISVDEFIVAFKGQLNSTRKAVVDAAYNKLDKDGNGKITIEDISKIYNVKNHVKVKAGEKTEEEVLKALLQNFADPAADGSITKDSWYNHYSAMSATIESDEFFVESLKSAWHL